MKKLLTLLFVVITSAAFSQAFKEDPNFIKQAPNSIGYMIDTVSESKLNKLQLYSNALAYLTNHFKDSRSVVESKDLDLGEISFKGNSITSVIKSDTTKKGKITNSKWDIPLYFKCKIYVKDQKFKIILNSLNVAFMIGLPGIPLDPKSSDTFSQENKAACELAISIIKELSASLNKKPENEF